MLAPVLAEQVLPFDKVLEMEAERTEFLKEDMKENKTIGKMMKEMLSDRAEFELAVHDMTLMNTVQFEELEEAIHFEDYIGLNSLLFPFSASFYAPVTSF